MTPPSTATPPVTAPVIGPGRRERLRQAPSRLVAGSVAEVVGTELRLRGLRLRVGEGVTIHTADGPVPAEVVGLTDDGAHALTLGSLAGAARGDAVTRDPDAGTSRIGIGLLGRVVDGLGRPLDGGGPVEGEPCRVEQPAPSPLERQRIAQALPTGVRVIDTLNTIGKGQRIGLFAGSGVGKSTLLGMMARGARTDVQVLAMVGERGREVREFVEDNLDEETRARSVIVAATSDQPALLRVRAVLLATRIAEHFADAGADALLLCDSLTRVAIAQREIGLAAGEPPSARGYTPSVFALLPRLLERAGPRAQGTITGFYTVLVDGDDHDEPIADAARGILDGHLVLSRRMANAGRYPALDPLASLSRLAPQVRTAAQERDATAVRAALAAAEEVRELVELGAYQQGSNPLADQGLAIRDDAADLFSQTPGELTDAEESWALLGELAKRTRRGGGGS